MITLNGSEISDAKEITVEELIQRHKFVKSQIAIEINGTIIGKKDYATTRVREGDAIEVVSFVGGG